MLSIKPKDILLNFPELNQRKVFLAISGGIDSVVLLKILLGLKIKPILLHCNFKLRGEESDQDEKFIHELAKNNDLVLECAEFDTTAKSEEFGLTIQETARKLRYDWFSEMVDEKSILLTAHHLNDNIETFFINLLRGTGLKGLAGIPTSRENILRPLLKYSKIAVQEYALEKGLKWREDSSNQSNKYLRNKIRQSLVPSLIDLEDSFESKMGSTIQELNEANSFLENLSDTWRQACIVDNTISLETILSTNNFMLRNALKPYGIRRQNFEAFHHFLSGKSGGVFEAGGFTFTKTNANVVFRPKELEASGIFTLIESLPSKVKIKNGTIEFSFSDKTKVNTSIQQLDANKVTFPLTLRTAKEGDRITPMGMKGSKLVSRVFIDHKMNSFEKSEQLVLENHDGLLLSIIGICIAEEHKMRATTDKVIEIVNIPS